MNIKIIAVGKIKEDYLKQGIAEYLKRLSVYAKIEIIEVPDEKTPEGLSLAEEEIIKGKEEERISKHIKESTFLIPLAIEGKAYNSKEFAQYIEELAISGRSDITFIIGGSLGLSKNLLARGDRLLSFSRLTFPHQLMRLILVEQIYRVFKITKGEPYHK